MISHALFTDVSVDPQQRRGVGACLLLALPLAAAPDLGLLSGQLRFRQFTDTSSTMLELQTVLWGVELFREQTVEPEFGALRVHTDSQCVAGLFGRRVRLEAGGYNSARSGSLLANAALYREFYAAADALGFEVVKLAGHTATAGLDREQRLFTLVDRGARRELQRLVSS